MTRRRTATTALLGDELGPRGRRRVLIGSVVSGALLVVVVVVALRRLASRGQLDADLWRPLADPRVARFFLVGALNTVKAASAAMVGAVALGMVLALGRLARAAPLRWLAGTWVEFFRGFPLLLLLLFLAFGLPRYGIKLPLLWTLVLALTLYNGAVLGEIFRAGILSLDRGQTEAAYAIGLGYWQAMGSVIVPQAFRRMVPAIVSQLITLLKDTSLGFFVQYEELLRRGQLAGQDFRNLLQSLFVVAAMYVAANFVLSRLARRLEVRQRRRYRAGGIEVKGGPEDLVLVDASTPTRARAAPVSS
ncbi:MAG: amino acid ABC transporter permease [Actinobacteria bacterium]|nr:amino acid ABC transporter permease [Actinomycetota bacterium]